MSQPSRIQPGAALWGVLLGLGLAIAIAACAQASHKEARTPIAAGPSEAVAAGPDIDPRKQEIIRLSNEIRQWRISKDMTPEPPIDLTQRPELLQPDFKKLRQCPEQQDPPKTDECTDVCTLKDDICDNAESICRIADELGDDAWAQEKCKSAKASCKQATDKCCGCLADEKRP
jgi:hypothetical protein